MTTPTAISVVIPLHDKAHTVARAVRSAASQSHPPSEIVVVDDGSRDDGAVRAAATAAGLVRVVTQRNAGASAARNTGVAAARGDLVAFLDADDEWGREHLATIAGLAVRWPEASLYSTSFERRRPGAPGAMADVSVANAHVPRGDCRLVRDYAAYRRQRLAFHASSIAVRPDRHHAFGGFPVGAVTGEDLAYVLAALLDGSAAFANVSTAVYHLGVPGQVTSQAPELSRDGLVMMVDQRLETMILDRANRRALAWAHDEQLLHLQRANILWGPGLRPQPCRFRSPLGKALAPMLAVGRRLPAPVVRRGYGGFQRIRRVLGRTETDT